MNEADIRRLVEQIRGSTPASPGSEPGGARAVRPDRADDAPVPLLTEIVRTPRPAPGSAAHRSIEHHPYQGSESAADETWVVALEARIVEQVMARLQASAQPLLDAAFDELLAQRLARLAGSLAAELRGSLEARLRDELGARVRQAVHEAVWDAIDHKGPPQRHL